MPRTRQLLYGTEWHVVLEEQQTSFGSCFLDKPIYLQVAFLDSTGKRVLMLESSLVLVAQRAWRNTHIAGPYGILPPESLHTLELYSIHLIFLEKLLILPIV